MPNATSAPLETSGAAKEVVALWVSACLPQSETFVRDQALAYPRWSSTLLAYRRLRNGLDVTPAFAPYTDALVSRAVSKALGLRPHARRLVEILSRPEVRVVHAHFGPSGIQVARYAARAGVPLVVTFHGYDVTRLPAQPGAAGEQYRHELRLLFGQAAALVAVSDFIAGRLRELGAPENKIFVHRIGIPITDLDSTPQEDREGIIFVGRMVEKKGLEDLLTAVSLLPADLRDVPVTVIGYGPLEAQAREQARALRVSIHFTGALSSSEVRERLKRAAVLGCLSKTASDGDCEGLPISLLEGGLLGAAIVATRHAGIPEFISHNETGLLVDERDVRGAAQNIERLLRDPQTASRLGLSARQRVLEEFDIERNARDLETLYDQVS